MNPELAVIIPTYNEIGNVKPLIARLDEILEGISWEVIFVDDDSADHTAEEVRKIATQRSDVRCIHRIGRRGLSSACIEGFLSCGAPYLAVMDGDLQHDETLLPLMLKTLKEESLDVVIGSRYVDQGDTSDWSKKRLFISQLGTRVGKWLVKADLKDPLSGFFMLRRSFFDRVVRRLTGKGFKILLDLFASANEPIKFKELPFKFKTRTRGESKLDAMVSWEYILLIADKSIGRYVPVRFILFMMVGLTGAVIHIAVLGLCLKVLSLNFLQSQIMATFLAMTSNFIVDNTFTYRDMKLHGKEFVSGIGSFYVACSIGALVNIQVANFLYSTGIFWWFAGLLGAIIGGTWNYAITRTFTWSKRQLKYK